MDSKKKNVLLISMPFAVTTIPSIQLALLESYLQERKINVKSRHLYLKAAEFIGLKNYNYLINAPNNPHEAQLTFCKYVFPEHWEKSKDKFEEYFNKKLINSKEIQKEFTFENYVESIDKFYTWVIENVGWRLYDIIGFTLNFGQFLPSLAISKKIKEIYPDKKIVFGGGTTTGELGIKVLESFSYIDFIVSGEGEEALYRLASNYQSYPSIPRLIYRDKNDIIWNREKNLINLDSLPIPVYDSFFEELRSSSEEIKKYFAIFGMFPVENSRGCWWNRCSFCNLNLQHNIYGEKSADRIVGEIKFLQEKYGILNFQFIGNTLTKNRNDIFVLLKKINDLGKDIVLCGQMRAGVLKRDDFKFLRESGLNNLEIGIESFSKSYLKKINKGVSVIDNIAALKFCRENRISLLYNLIINYPNEEKIDFEETKKNIYHIKTYLDPPQYSPLFVAFGSPIYCMQEAFNIEKIEYTDIDKIMFPDEFLKKGFSQLYYFKRKKDLGQDDNEWHDLIKDWSESRKRVMDDKLGIRISLPIDELVFYYLDGGSNLKIYDKREPKNIKLFVLDSLERKIFLLCNDVISIKKLQENLPEIQTEKLTEILKGFEDNGIIFREEDRILSLPLSYKLLL